MLNWLRKEADLTVSGTYGSLIGLVCFAAAIGGTLAVFSPYFALGIGSVGLVATLLAPNE